MFKLSETIDVTVPPQVAFDWVADVENLTRWQSGVFASKLLTPPPAKVGTRFTEALKVMGLKLTSTCEVTELVAPKTYAFVARGSQMNYTSRFDFAAAPGGGTRMTLQASITMRGFWKLMEPMVRAEGSKETKEELRRLKAAMESDNASRPPLKVAASR
ncbi:MAG: SRPBCC family protein [Cucumibacter sp.]